MSLDKEAPARVEAASLDGRAITVVHRNGAKAAGRVISCCPRGLEVHVEFDTWTGPMQRLVTLDTFLAWNPSFCATAKKETPRPPRPLSPCLRAMLAPSPMHSAARPKRPACAMRARPPIACS